MKTREKLMWSFGEPWSSGGVAKTPEDTKREQMAKINADFAPILRLVDLISQLDNPNRLGDGAAVETYCFTTPGSSGEGTVAVNVLLEIKKAGIADRDNVVELQKVGARMDLHKLAHAGEFKVIRLPHAAKSFEFSDTASWLSDVYDKLQNTPLAVSEDVKAIMAGQKDGILRHILDGAELPEPVSTRRSFVKSSPANLKALTL